MIPANLVAPPVTSKSKPVTELFHVEQLKEPTFHFIEEQNGPNCEVVATTAARKRGGYIWPF